MREVFVTKKIGSDKLSIIETANRVIDDYQAQGLRLTLRQLYYQFIAQDLFPASWIDVEYNAKQGLDPNTKNTVKNYKKLGIVISDGRLAGLIDWDAVEDRGRQPREAPEWANLEQLIEGALTAYRLPRWRGQEHYVELWVEKEALSGVLQPIARRFHVTLMVNKGYCVSPETRVLTADLKWIAAKDIKSGFEILGVDESVPGKRKHRKLRLTKVNRVCRFTSPRVQVTTTYGTLVVSANHPFLTTRMSSDRVHWNNGYYWTNAEKLKPGDRIARLCSPWDEHTDWNTGWLAGIYDGEGCLPMNSLNVQLYAYQKPGITADSIRSALKERGWLNSAKLRPKKKKKGRVWIFGTSGVSKVLEFLGSVRPARLIRTFQESVRQNGWPSKSKQPAIVKSIKHLANGPVIGIETDSKTLITEGLVSHNSSQSAMYESSKRFIERENEGKTSILFYLGDHDPSGEDMVRDIQDRLDMFGSRTMVLKLAITRPQIEQYNPPPNPAKMSDSRAEKYVEEHGNQSWEVDALPPEALNGIVTQAFGRVLDEDLMAKVMAEEERDKTQLREAVDKLRKKRK